MRDNLAVMADVRVLDTIRYSALEFDRLMWKMLRERIKPSDLPEVKA